MVSPWRIAGRCLNDLKTENNTLSVWHILDDHSNKEQIVTALSATRQYIAQFAYFLIEEHFIHEINIKISEVIGNSPDRTINS